jgi:flagellar basal-body rod modification protein FlgD
MATSVTAVTAGAQAASSATEPLASKDVFLKLLVEQIKNQDPLSPMQGMDFVNQLSQFSSLEQLVSMRQDLDALAAKAGTDSTARG